MGGFSLTETLVGVAIAGIVILGVVYLVQGGVDVQNRQFAISDSDRETTLVLGFVSRVFQSKRKGPRFPKIDETNFGVYDPFYCESHIAAETNPNPGLDGVRRCYSYWIDPDECQDPVALTGCRRMVVWRGWPAIAGTPSTEEMFVISTECRSTGRSDFETGFNFGAGGVSGCNVVCGDPNDRPVVRIARYDRGARPPANPPNEEKFFPAFARTLNAGVNVRSSQKRSLGMELCFSHSNAVDPGPGYPAVGTLTFQLTNYFFDRSRDRSDNTPGTGLVPRRERRVLPEFTTISPAVEFFPNE